MAWRHVDDETIRVPQYEVEQVMVSYGMFGGFKDKSSTRPTGEFRDVTYSIWRCGNCRALACGENGIKPVGPCGKCKSQG